MKKTLPLALAISLAVTAVPGESNAKGPKDNNGNGIKWGQKAQSNLKFKDIEKHWAQETIEKMVALDIIKGYPDFTFKPDKPVTQAEAVVMVIRLLGLEEEAAGKGGVDLAFKNERSIPSWAKGSIAVALEEELIAKTNVFHANKPATRLFVMMLLVNAIDAEFDGNWEEAEEYFSDIDDLDNTEKLYLAYATLTNLVSGYKDNTFRPNKPVTRAEMATLLDRVLNHDDFDDEEDAEEGIGMIDSIDLDDQEITIVRNIINNDGSLKQKEVTYEISEDVEVYIDGEESKLSELTVDMNIEFVIEDDEIITIEAFGVEELLSQLDDLEELDLSIENKNYDAEISFELTDSNNGFVATVEVSKDRKNYILEGEAALEYLVNLFNDAGVSFDEDKLDVVNIYNDLVNYYELEDAQVEGKLVVDRISYEINQDAISNNETDDMLDLLEDVRSIDLTVTGDHDFDLSVQYQNRRNGDFEAAVHLVEEDRHIILAGKAALDFIVNITKDADVVLSDEDSVEELLEDIVDEYDVNNETINGRIVIGSNIIDLEDLF